MPMTANPEAGEQERLARLRSNAEQWRAMWPDEPEDRDEFYLRLLDARDARIATLAEAIKNIRGEAKVLRNARNLVGPVEYADKPQLAKVWWKTCYSIGKQFDKMCQSALNAAPAAAETGKE